MTLAWRLDDGIDYSPPQGEKPNCGQPPSQLCPKGAERFVMLDIFSLLSLFLIAFAFVPGIKELIFGAPPA